MKPRGTLLQPFSRDQAPTGRRASQGPPLRVARHRRPGGVAAMVTFKKVPVRAQFEISIDGKPCSYRDRKDIAMAAAEFLKRKFPHSEVVVKHLPSGEVTVAAYKPHDTH